MISICKKIIILILRIRAVKYFAFNLNKEGNIMPDYF